MNKAAKEIEVLQRLRSEHRREFSENVIEFFKSKIRVADHNGAKYLTISELFEIVEDAENHFKESS